MSYLSPEKHLRPTKNLTRVRRGDVSIRRTAPLSYSFRAIPNNRISGSTAREVSFVSATRHDTTRGGAARHGATRYLVPGAQLKLITPPLPETLIRKLEAEAASSSSSSSSCLVFVEGGVHAPGAAVPNFPRRSSIITDTARHYRETQFAVMLFSISRNERANEHANTIGNFTTY